jgi:ribosomal protein S18 acetylase RimI-like enzyme
VRAEAQPLVTIEPVPAREVLSLRREITAVWQWATEARLDDLLPRHAARAGFRFLAARTNRGLAGFAYGFCGGTGHWWHELVAAAMTPRQRTRWLPDGYFELAELHVRPDCQRRGIGGRLHDELLRGVTGPTAVLSTQVDNEPALALYDGRGWTTILPEVEFGSGRLFCILGLDLERQRSGFANLRPVSS